MSTSQFSSLESAFGSENVERLTSAYQSALIQISDGRAFHEIGTETRLAIVTTLLAEARKGVFDPQRLKETAVAVVISARLAGL